jgi:hypothetical protein
MSDMMNENMVLTNRGDEGPLVPRRGAAVPGVSPAQQHLGRARAQPARRALLRAALLPRL